MQTKETNHLLSISGNEVKAEALQRLLSDFTSQTIFALTGAKEMYVYEGTGANKKRTETISHIVYQLTDPKTFQYFQVRVNTTHLVISPDELEQERQSGNPIFVEVPIQETIVKPYDISYGKAKISIQAPSVKLIMGTDKKSALPRDSKA